MCDRAVVDNLSGFVAPARVADAPRRKLCRVARYDPIDQLRRVGTRDDVLVEGGAVEGGALERHDAVIVGGGHNGLVAAAYLARAGWKVLVCERRHVLGGAAVTEEIFPGFRFSVASYVVSLLRPEIIRDLDLPRHGLEILPLDGTFTPLDGDYLWRSNDHGRTTPELRRWSRMDAA